MSTGIPAVTRRTNEKGLVEYHVSSNGIADTHRNFSRKRWVSRILPCYQQDVREQVAAIQRQNTAMLVDAFTPYGHAKNLGVGLWNLGVKTVGGVLSAPVALTGVDNGKK